MQFVYFCLLLWNVLHTKKDDSFGSIIDIKYRTIEITHSRRIVWIEQGINKCWTASQWDLKWTDCSNNDSNVMSSITPNPIPSKIRAWAHKRAYSNPPDCRFTTELKICTFGSHIFYSFEIGSDSASHVHSTMICTSIAVDFIFRQIHTIYAIE